VGAPSGSAIPLRQLALMPLLRWPPALRAEMAAHACTSVQLLCASPLLFARECEEGYHVDARLEAQLREWQVETPSLAAVANNWSPRPLCCPSLFARRRRPRVDLS